VPERPLAGTLAVVTGALGNLGPLWVTTLAGAGARVLGIDVRDEGADALAEAAGGAFELVLADVTDRGALEALAERHGTPGVLVNNAGIDQPPDAGAARHAIEDVPMPDFLRGSGSQLAIGMLFVKLAAFLGLGWVLFTSGVRNRPDPIGFALGLTCFPAAAVWEAMRARRS